MPVLNLSTKHERGVNLSDIPVGHVAQCIKFPVLTFLICTNGDCVALSNNPKPDFMVEKTKGKTFEYRDLGPLKVEI